MSRFWGKKVDSNHAEIRQAFRDAGWQWLDLHRLGGGAPDGLVMAPWGDLHLIEIKPLEGKLEPKATKAKGATKIAQKSFASTWRVAVISTVEQAAAFRMEHIGYEAWKKSRSASGLPTT